MNINAKTNLVEWVRQCDAEELCGTLPAALGSSYTVWDPRSQVSVTFPSKEMAEAYKRLDGCVIPEGGTLATMKMTKMKPPPKHAAVQAQLRGADALKRQHGCQFYIGAGQKARDRLWNEVWRRQVDEMMLASPPAIYVSKEECEALEPYLDVAVAAKTEDRGPVSDEDHMGILALELKQALCPKPEPQEVQPPKQAPRVHGIGTVAAMGHRMGAGFGGDPDL
jgi:hypothetical protein